MSTTYLYGIIPTGGQVRFTTPPQNDLMSPVYTITEGGVGTVVSDSYLSGYRGLSKEEIFEHLIRYQRVVETVMSDYPLLPVKFGTFLPGPASVQCLLHQKGTLFRQTLDRLAGYTQAEIVALWDVPQILREIAQELDIEQRRQTLAELPPERVGQEQMVIGQLVKSALEGKRVVIRELIMTALRQVATDVVLNPALNEEMIANVALLLDERGRLALDDCLAALDARFEGRFTFHNIGPLPPYSFATVEVQTATLDQLVAARQQLGVANTATLTDIHHAYQRRASQVQADLNPLDPTATKTMAALTETYHLLMTYTESQTAAGQGDRQRRAETMLVSVRRQETAPQYF